MAMEIQPGSWESIIAEMKRKKLRKCDEELLRRLAHPAGKVDVVLDTDTFNEIDDQYALAYLIKSEEKLNLKAIYAAPFFNSKAKSAQDGMEKSYQEILNILTLLERDDLKAMVYRGSETFMPSETVPVLSEAASHLAELAMSYSAEKPLYVIAIGAITNVASAILLQPEIVDRIVLIWLGGHGLHWPHNAEFNLAQDVAGARIVFGCGVALVSLPCMGVVSAFTISGPELVHHLKGKNKLCDYLVDVTEKEALAHGGNSTWTRSIWDVTTIAWLLDESFMEVSLEHAPIPEYDHHFAMDPTRHLYKYVYHIHRDKLFEDLFRKLQK